MKPGRDWSEAIAAFEAHDKVSPPPKGAVVFTGASNFTRWSTLSADFPRHTILNRAFGGARMSDVLHYAERIVVPYAPRMVVLQAGGNDVAAGRPPDDIVADFKAFTARIRAALPGVRIAYLSVPANSARWELRDLNQRVNAGIREFVASQANMRYIDGWGPSLGADGRPRDDLYGPDRLHVNAQGYRLYIRLIEPYLDEP